MQFFRRVVDLATRESESPVRRLIGYYAVLAGVTALLLYLFPPLRLVFEGEHVAELTGGTRVLEDALLSDQFTSPVVQLPEQLSLTILILAVMLGSVLLMLPVSWVYMSTKRTKGYDQAIVQALILLPIVVAGIVFIVRNSLALAFALAGIVAGVRFRTRLRDARDGVFVFLAIGVGLAAGVQALTVAAVLSVIFNFIALLVWRSDFGRTVLEPSPATQWAAPLSLLAEKNGNTVPDRDLVLALTPERASALAKRFDRLRQLVGDDGKNKKPRYNALLWVTTNNITEAQRLVEQALDRTVKRWKLDEVVTNEGKPSELYYLVRLRKSVDEDAVLTVVRDLGDEHILTADVEFHEQLLSAAEE